MSGMWFGGQYILQSTIENSLSLLREENKQLRELVKHCWVHSGYRDCGRAQMDYRMREMYDKINNGADDE